MSLNQAQTDDLDAFRATDRDFHDQISLIAGNSMLSNNVARARDLCQALRQRDVIRDQVSIDCGRAHVAIASAIATRDEATASRQMSSHVEYVRDVVLCAFEKS